MNEYINREHALSLIDSIGSYTYRDEDLDRAYEAIRDEPAADVAPVVHGEWDDSFDGITPVCLVCKRTHHTVIRTPDYCPNCGAKMDGGMKHDKP